MENKKVLLEYLAERAEKEKRKTIGMAHFTKQKTNLYSEIKKIIELEQKGNSKEEIEKICEKFKKDLKNASYGATYNYHKKLKWVIEKFYDECFDSRLISLSGEFHEIYLDNHRKENPYKTKKSPFPGAR
ncbi:MAG: hypothetical protein FWE47_01330 [Oscillospiraceae bacterium]|nr:hypothetical protein [Oscillospiraceae bacterium]